MGVTRTTNFALYLLLGICIQAYAAKAPYKLCSLPGTERNDCPQLERSNRIDCVQNFHGIDCILNIEQGKSDFGRVTPEEALIAAKFVKNVVVLGEFRSDIGEEFLFSTAVLVRHDHTDGFKGLKGKKYCHPGFKHETTVTELVLKEFENTVLKQNDAEGCNNKVASNTILEKELKALTDFFGPSCRPGPWIDLDETNKDYYKKYSKLCELCIPNSGCTIPTGEVPFMRSLDCLVNGGGDITVTTMTTIDEFFTKPENVIKQDDFRYLCRNGTISTLDRPCVWAKQPNNLIIAHQDQAESIKSDLESWIPKKINADSPTPYAGGDEAFEESLVKVLFPPESEYRKIKFSLPRLNLQDYLEKYRVIPVKLDVRKCDRDVKWCTASNEEQQKCLWLAQASLNNAFQPVLECVQSPSKLGCLEDIKKDNADVVTADAHHGYIARKKKLSPLAYPETDRKNLVNTVVVIKASNELGIQRFENLKTRKACIPEYGGIEWLSFINAAQENKVLSKTTCDYDELISDFVGDSCMPGAHDPQHEKSEKLNSEKLCSLCIPKPNAATAKTCNSDNDNAYYGNLGALQCLKDTGDFAVITLNKEGYTGFNANEFRVLCKNGSLAADVGFNVDSNCVLTTIVDSEVVSKRDNPKNNDIGVTLLNFERRFGTDRTKAFEVFNVFNNTKDLLFMDTTIGLGSPFSTNPYIKNYISLFEHVDKCVVKNDPNPAASAQATMVLPLFLSIIIWMYAQCKH